MEPGEKYEITLKTKTGNVSTRQPISDIILTRPEKPKGILVSDVLHNSCTVSWVLPNKNHSCLRGFQMRVEYPDGKLLKDFAVLKHIKNHKIDGLQPCQVHYEY